MKRRDPLRWPLIAVLFGGAAVAALFAGPYWLTILTDIAILAIFALSIDFMLGYGGLVTLGHAGFMGVGAYAVGYLSHFAGWPVGLAIVAAVAAGAAAALAVGWLVVRVSGVFFIMVTLAFSMMFYSWASKLRLFGGDDGVAGMKRLDLRMFGIDLADPRLFCLLVVAVAVLCFAAFEALARSPFGQTLKAIRQNENRIRAQGCPVQTYKLAAFAVAGAAAAIAGILHQQHVKAVNPEIAHWFKSGEGLIMVIVGGAGTLAGPVLGAFLFELFHKIVEPFTQYWRMAIGIVFIAIVLAAPDGLYGRLRSLLERRRPGA